VLDSTAWATLMLREAAPSSTKLLTMRAVTVWGVDQSLGWKVSCSGWTMTRTESEADTSTDPARTVVWSTATTTAPRGCEVSTTV